MLTGERYPCKHFASPAKCYLITECEPLSASAPICRKVLGLGFRWILPGIIRRENVSEQRQDFLFNQIAHVAESVYALPEGVGNIPIHYATFEARGHRTFDFMAPSKHNVHLCHRQVTQTLRPLPFKGNPLFLHDRVNVIDNVAIGEGTSAEGHYSALAMVLCPPLRHRASTSIAHTNKQNFQPRLWGSCHRVME